MKTLLLGLIALGSMSAFGATYTGLDANGDSCYVEIISRSYEDQNFVKVVTKEVVSGAYTLKKVTADLTLKNEFTQGTESMTLRTRDTIKVQIVDNKPVRGSVLRQRAVKGSGLFSMYRNTEDYGGEQEVHCDIQ